MITKNYVISFKRIGEGILMVTPSGDLSEFDAEKVHSVLTKVYSQTFKPGQQFVEVENLSFVHGKPKRDERKKLVQLKKNVPEEYRGYIVTGASFTMKALLKSSFVSKARLGFIVKFVSNRGEALRYAQKLLEGNVQDLLQPVKLEDFTHNNNWIYTSIKRKYRGSFKVAKGCVLYVKHSGDELLKEDIIAFEKIEERIFREKHINQKDYIRIVDYSEMGQTPIRIRKLYAAEINRIQMLLGVKAVKTLIINPPTLVKVALLFVQKIVDMNFVFVNSLNDAIDEINSLVREQNKPLKNRPMKYSVTSDDIELLTEKLGTLVWDELEKGRGGFSDTHPFKEVLEAFNLVKQDYQAMNSEIQIKNKELEHLNTELKVTIQKVNEMAMKAEHANIAKSKFLSNMSHEIRTPLNGVIGMTDLLLESELKPDQADYVEIIRNSGSSLLDLINDILDFAKIESGKLEFETQEFNIRAAMDVVSDMLYIKAENKDLEFGCIVDEDVPQYLIGDPARFRQCVLNLATNAIKFTEEGYIMVHVSLKGLSKDGSVIVHCLIEDTGIGIPENLHESIFESFTQGDSSTTRAHGGTGLGAAITKQLVDLMNGKIGFDSVLNKGSRFWFTAQFGQSDRCDAPIDFESEKIKKLRVLIADNSKISRQIFKRYLESVGCTEVDEALGSNGHLKIEAACDAGNPYDLLIFDQNILDNGKKDFCKNIKLKKGMAKTGCILCASKASKGDALEMQSVGFDAYLSKPVKKFELLKTIEMLMFGDAKPNEIVTRYSVRGMEDKNEARVLLVEDNKMNQKIAVSMLKKCQYHNITIAENGQEALQLCLDNEYDVVLMDCQMPIMDGFETTYQIRRIGTKNSTVPIIALTANALLGDDQKCYSAGMDDYMTKPMKLKVLKEHLALWTDRRHIA